VISKVEIGKNFEGGNLAANEAVGNSDVGDFDEQAWDDANTGVELDVEEARKGRDEEVKFLVKEHIYEKRAYDECVIKTGKPPTSVRWIDANKGSKENPNIRCRLVARDLKDKGGSSKDLFAAMPPLDAKKLIMAMCAARWRKWLVGLVAVVWKMMFVDVRKAHAYAICDDEEAYIELPLEDAEEGKCAKLMRWLYGMRGAARSWEKQWRSKFESVGYIMGKSAPTIMGNHSKLGASYVVMISVLSDQRRG
jgi:hypothetical protein